MMFGWCISYGILVTIALVIVLVLNYYNSDKLDKLKKLTETAMDTAVVSAQTANMAAHGANTAAGAVSGFRATPANSGFRATPVMPMPNSKLIPLGRSEIITDFSHGPSTTPQYFDEIVVNDSSHTKFLGMNNNANKLKKNKFNDARKLDGFKNHSYVDAEEKHDRAADISLKQTFPIFQDWNEWDKSQRDDNNYAAPTGYKNINGRFYYPMGDELNYETQIFPYHDYMAYDPYDFVAGVAWPVDPARTWGKGQFDEMGREFPTV